MLASWCIGRFSSRGQPLTPAPAPTPGRVTPPAAGCWPPAPALQMVRLERALPYDIQAGTNVVRFFQRPPEEPFESGVEGLNFVFRHEPYNGHHLASSSCAAGLSGAATLPHVPWYTAPWSGVMLHISQLACCHFL